MTGSETRLTMGLSSSVSRPGLRTHLPFGMKPLWGRLWSGLLM